MKEIAEKKNASEDFVSKLYPDFRTLQLYFKDQYDDISRGITKIIFSLYLCKELHKHSK